MNVRWIIESGVLSYSYSLVKYLQKNDIYYKETNYQEVISHNYIDDFGGLVDSEVATIFVGSLRLAKEINQYPVDPGVICTLDNFKCTKYYPSWSPYLLNHDWLIKMKCILERDIYDLKRRNYDPDKKMFFRPDSGDKHFTGGVLSRTQLFEYINDYELVIQATTKNIGDEYRFLIVDRNIVDFSQYTNKLEEDNEEYTICNYYNYLKQVLEDNTLLIPDRAFTVDIGVNLNTEELGVIELNSFSCANLYDMNMDKVVPAINELAKDMYKKANIDW